VATSAPAPGSPLPREIGAGATLAFLGCGWIALILCSSLAAVLRVPRVPAPDVVMLIVLFVGLTGRGTAASVCALGAALGYLGDLFAGSPKGLHLLACALLALLARAASSRLLVRGPIATAGVAFVTALGFGAAVVTLRVTALGDGPLGDGFASADARAVLVSALSTAAAAPAVFPLLRRIERFFHRDPRALAVGS